MSDEDVTTYGVSSTSRRTADFDPVEITLRGDPDGSQRRLVLRVSEVEDPPTPGATLQATFVYQHRRKADDDWSEDNFNLATLKAGESLRMQLHSGETQKVFEALSRLYAASAEGVQRGRYAVTVTSADAPVAVVPKAIADQIQELLETEGIAAFEAMMRARPDLAEWSLSLQEHRQRAADFAEFEAHLDEDPPTWDEHDWQAFFRRAPWIFGHGLDYTFLVNEQAEPNYDGQDLGGEGGARGDELMRTAGQFRFAVLVELKKPGTDLISGSKPYRNGAWRIGAEVAGGVAQLQANCERIRLAADTRENVRYLDDRDMTVADPQAILVIGHTRLLVDDYQRASFHRFRRNLWNPTVLTYDELLERARFLVGKAADRVEAASVEGVASEPIREPRGRPPIDADDDLDDLPF